MNNIKELREKINLTQQEIASKLNVSQCTFHNYETGKRNINLDMCRRIVAALSVKGRKVSINDVFPPRNKKATNAN